MNTARTIVNALLYEKYDFPDTGEQDKPEHYADFEIDPDSPEAFQAHAQAKLDSVKKIEIQGRRWWRRGIGGEYCTAHIYINDKLVHVTPEQGGSGDQYLWLATDWLRRNGWIDIGPRDAIWHLRDEGRIKLVYDCTDVRRERDLF